MRRRCWAWCRRGLAGRRRRRCSWWWSPRWWWRPGCPGGSAESFQVCIACGLSPNARQIRETADCDMPVAAAIDRVDQCVSRPGVDSNVLVTTSSTRSSEMTRGRPGRGSSDSPSSRSARNRERHFDTVARDKPNSTATSPIVPPSAHRNTIRARDAKACAVFRRHDHPVNTECSSSDNTTGTSFGLGTTPSLPSSCELTTQDTRRCSTGFSARSGIYSVTRR